VTMLKGADISFPGDAKAMKAAGLDFAITEAVVNGTTESGSAAGNLAAFRAEGLLCGAYIFAIYARKTADGTTTATDPVAAGKACAAIFNRLPQLDIPAALDIEQPLPGSSPPNYTIPIPGPAIVDWCIQFAQAFLADYTAFPVMLFYSFPSYTSQFRDALAAKADEMGRLFLPWPASPSAVPFPAEGALPFQADPKKTQYFIERPWGQSWTFWQTQGNARLPGVPHIVDVDVFRGTRDDLANLGRATIGPAPAPGGPVSATRKGVIAAVIAAFVAAGLWWANRSGLLARGRR
jgi:hypothetical protein